jgi:hypothetical protein
METKRFIITELDTDEGMRFADEKQVSDRIDMADCIDGNFEIHYITDGPNLEKVKCANFVKCDEDSWENGIVGYSDLVTEETNQNVGTVTHTDH